MPFSKLQEGVDTRLAAPILECIASSANPREILDNIKIFVEHHGIEVFRKLATIPIIPLQKEEIHYKATLLYYAAMNNMHEVVAELIAHEVAFDVGTSCEENPTLDELSPLMAACEHATTESFEHLLKKANLDHENGNHMTVLMFASSLEMFKKICDEVRLQKKDVLNWIYARSCEGFTILDYACKKGLEDVITYLVAETNWNEHISPQYFLHKVRVASLEFPNKKKAFDKVCDKIRPKVLVSESFSEFTDKTTTKLLRYESYDKLFELSMPFICQTKEEAVRDAISQFHCLLRTPLLCLPYLQRLNKELAGYFFHKHKMEFPYLPFNSYQFKIIDGLHCPIPSPDYKGIKKHCVLQEWLITFLKKYGLAQHASKWMGFVSPEKTDDMIKRGDFFVEHRIGPGLLHGKFSHMIQLYILCCAVEENKISLKYSQNNKEFLITLLDILEGLTTESAKTLIKPWTSILDMRTINKISFTDPNRLNEFIMYFGDVYELNILSHYLIDSFCKGFNAMLKSYHAHGHADLTQQDLVDVMRDLDSTSFALPKFLIQYSIAREEKTKKSLFVEQTSSYAIVRKSYNT